jgi:hypothetical protein
MRLWSKADLLQSLVGVREAKGDGDDEKGELAEQDDTHQWQLGAPARQCSL